MSESELRAAAKRILESRNRLVWGNMTRTIDEHSKVKGAYADDAEAIARDWLEKHHEPPPNNDRRQACGRLQR